LINPKTGTTETVDSMDALLTVLEKWVKDFPDVQFNLQIDPKANTLSPEPDSNSPSISP